MCVDDEFVCESECGWETCGGPGCAGFGEQVCGVASEGIVCQTPMLACDLFAQSCPRGEKCTSWDNDADQLFNATRCSPVDAAPAPVGGACTFEGSPYSGIDDCVVGAMCLLTDPEDDTSGICRAACIGNPYNASCDDPEMTCVLEEDWFGWCVPA